MIADVGISLRADVVGGDVTAAGELPSGHDVRLLANLIHYFSPAENHAVLRRVRGPAEVGARPLPADFWTDATHTEPLMAALMAGEFAVHLRHGDVYSVDEVRQWPDVTGWRFLEHLPLARPNSLVVAEATRAA